MYAGRPHYAFGLKNDVSAPPRPPSRLELLDPAGYQPQLALSPELAFAPQETAPPERRRTIETWQALQATPEDVLRDRRELDKLDRGLVAVRHQMHTARADAAAAKARVAQIEKERYPAAAVWGTAGVALVAAFGWLHQRRKVLALQREEDPVHFHPLLASPAAFPPAIEPRGESDFEPTELEVRGDEADQWIERAKVAVASS